MSARPIIIHRHIYVPSIRTYVLMTFPDSPSRVIVRRGYFAYTNAIGRTLARFEVCKYLRAARRGSYC